MIYYAKLYAATFVVFMAIDALWLGVIARSFYKKYLGFILTDTPNWYAAFAFYLLFVVGILVFVVVPGLKETALMPTLLRAALFGLIAYATYDLTNLATIKGWPVIVTVVDSIWGAVLSLSVSFISLKIGQWLG